MKRIKLSLSLCLLGGGDLIVGDIPNAVRWGSSNGITAYSLGVNSCNEGDERIDCQANTSHHPVLSQGMYRWKDGRFEQIGQSWVKHLFFALSQSLCRPCTDPTNGSEMGVGCSDSNSASSQGQQGMLGPRYEINAASGLFPYPFSNPSPPPIIGRRLQVHDDDLNPALNLGARYFVEAQFISSDDSASGNGTNNASYREVTVSQTQPEIYQLGFSAVMPTQREQPAIFAWQQMDSDVQLVSIDVPGDGRFWLGYQVRALPGGRWSYEYALQNLNSDRSARLFTFFFELGVQIENVGFHDVDPHSGPAGFNDGGDWEVILESHNLTWSTATYEENPLANALRWGSLFNFRFEADAPPIPGFIEIGLFKPGASPTVQVPALVPGHALALLSSNPPAEAIDARQPYSPAGNPAQGWQSVDLEFNGSAQTLRAEDFLLNQEGGMGETPAIISIENLSENRIRALLSQPISVGAWTRLEYLGNGQAFRLGYLPADVNGDRTSTAVDILQLIDALNLVSPRPIYATDIDRSGVQTPADILRLIDLLNGAGEYDPFLNRSLP